MAPRRPKSGDVTVILKQAYKDKMPEAVEQLKKAGLEVRSADDNNSVIEGSLETCNVHSLEKCDCVQYVRKGLISEATSDQDSVCPAAWTSAGAHRRGWSPCPDFYRGVGGGYSAL